MLIEKLVAYAREHDVVGDPLFEKKNVRWWIEIGPGGDFLGITDTASDGKRGREELVPKKVGANSGGVAAFGTDNPRFVLGYSESGVDPKVERDFPAFVELIRRAAAEDPSNQGLAAVHAFYCKQEAIEQARSRAAELKVKDGDRMAVAFTGDHGVPLFDTAGGKAFWRRLRAEQEASRKVSGAVVCLSCGRQRPPVLTNDTKIMGVPDGQPSGTALVSYDKESFQSFGWDKNINAPVCEECSQAYTRGLNHLLRRDTRPRTRIDMAGVAYAFWLDGGAEAPVDLFFEEPDSEEAERVLTAARRGELPTGAPNVHLYALGLRGNGGRAVVVDWFDTSLADAYRNAARWFDDLEVTLLFDEKEHGTTYKTAGGPSRRPRLWTLAMATARESDDISPRVPVALFRAALRGDALPLSLAERCIRRLPLDGFGDFFAPARIGLIRCTLNRHNYGERKLMPGLDTGNTDPAYLCGRLMATLEAIQYAGVGDVGANVVDRFYGKASTAPSLAFGPLLTLAQSHLGAIANDGQRVNLDRELSAIIGQLDARLPHTLTLEQQGVFAIGYYHQKAHRFAEVQRRRDERAAANSQEGNE